MPRIEMLIPFGLVLLGSMAPIAASVGESSGFPVLPIELAQAPQVEEGTGTATMDSGMPLVQQPADGTGTGSAEGSDEGTTHTEAGGELVVVGRLVEFPFGGVVCRKDDDPWVLLYQVLIVENGQYSHPFIPVEHHCTEIQPNPDGGTVTDLEAYRVGDVHRMVLSTEWPAGVSRLRSQDIEDVYLALRTDAVSQAEGNLDAPENPHIVVGRFVARPENGDRCGDARTAEIMQYQVISVESGEYSSTTIWVAHECAELPRGMVRDYAGDPGTFTVGDIHRMVLSPEVTDGIVLVGAPEGISGLFWATRTMLVPRDDVDPPDTLETRCLPVVSDCVCLIGCGTGVRQEDGTYRVTSSSGRWRRPITAHAGLWCVTRPVVQCAEVFRDVEEPVCTEPDFDCRDIVPEICDERDDGRCVP